MYRRDLDHHEGHSQRAEIGQRCGRGPGQIAPPGSQPEWHENEQGAERGRDADDGEQDIDGFHAGAIDTAAAQRRIEQIAEQDQIKEERSVVGGRRYIERVVGDEFGVVVAGDKLADFLERFQAGGIDHLIAVGRRHVLQPGDLFRRERLPLEERRG